MPFIIHRSRPEPEPSTEPRYRSLLESVLTRLAFGIMAGAAGGLGGWMWRSWLWPGRPVWIITAIVGLVAGLLLGDKIPADWLRPW